jgi:hypothetical protein
MNRLGRLARVFALVLVIALGTPVALVGPARAEEPESNTWLRCEGMPPTTGALNYFEAYSYVDAEQVWRAYVIGDIFSCRAPGPRDVFAVASYDDDGAVQGWAAPYPEQTEFYGYVKVHLNASAVCAISNVKDRLDCFKIDWIPQPAGPPLPTAGYHIPVDSPNVLIDAKVDLNKVYAVDPGCPTCVDD